MDDNKVIFLDDISEIFNYDYIKKTVGYSNYGDPYIIFINNKINKCFYLNEDNELKDFCFDKVTCYGSHSFGGTSYDKFFYLNGELIKIEFTDISMNVDDLIKKQKLINDYIINKNRFEIINIKTPIFDFNETEHYVEDKMFSDLKQFQNLMFEKVYDGFDKCFLYSIEYKYQLFFIRYKFLKSFYIEL